MKTESMTKKLALAALLLMLNVVGIYAQKLDGTWKAGKAFQEAVSNDPDAPNVDLTLTFKGNKFVPCLRMSQGDDEMSLDLEVWVEGTFLCKKDGVVNTFIDGSKLQIKILSLTTTDAEANELLSTEEGRKTIYTLIEEGTKEKVVSDLDGVWQLLRTFKVESLTSDKLVVSVDDSEMDFDRVAERKW